MRGQTGWLVLCRRSLGHGLEQVRHGGCAPWHCETDTTLQKRHRRANIKNRAK
jgi:hypothetical protein